MNPTAGKFKEIKYTNPSENDFICRNICQRKTFRFLDHHQV